ncbi:MAG: alpha/beta fold hydrolase [Deltaproteobacteria bacterium]|nr:MAG: alpha/beta fold hydrolase [Deltaproteobacteria bacterium]
MAGMVLAHGAGAGIDHPFMVGVAEALARHGVATWTFNFPYMQAGRRRIDPRPTLYRTWKVALETARARWRGGRGPLLAGGKSMGGRVLAEALARGELGPPPAGIVFLGFPLHPAGRPGTDRAASLRAIDLPMWFGAGTRDRLADLERLRRVVAELGPRATLHVVEGADHGFAVRKRDGRTFEEVLDELAGAAAAWIREHVSGDEPVTGFR